MAAKVDLNTATDWKEAKGKWGDAGGPGAWRGGDPAAPHSTSLPGRPGERSSDPTRLGPDTPKSHRHAPLSIGAPARPHPLLDPLPKF